jgi:hypothetical protein
MKHLKGIYILIIFVAALTLHSCEYLSEGEYLNETTTVDSLFTTYADIQKAWFYCFDDIPASFPVQYCAADGTVSQMKSSIYTKFQIGTYSASSGTDYWSLYYRSIRHCTFFMLSMETQKSSVLKFYSQEKIDQWTADAKFLRAFYYWSLMKEVGPVIILPTDRLINFTEDFVSKRNTYDECVDFVLNELDEAIDLLPTTRGVNELGLPNKGMAMAVKAELLTTAASPLYNGNSMYAEFVDPQTGTPLINQTYDATKWDKAAAANKAIIDLGIYSLHTEPITSETKYNPDLVWGNGDDTPLFPDAAVNYPNGAGGIDNYLSYKHVFDGNALNNDEVIWAGDAAEWRLLYHYPRAQIKPVNPYTGVTFFGYNSISVTLKYVDNTYMCDGRTYEDWINDGTKGFSLANDIEEANIYSEIVENKGDGRFVKDSVTAKIDLYPARAIYREPRFYANVGPSGKAWYTGPTYESDKDLTNYYANYGYDGADRMGIGGPNNQNYSGFTVCKWFSESDYMPKQHDNSQFNQKQWIYYRLADIYLMYAEALNEGSSRNTSEIKKYFNRVRFRAGLPGVDNATLNDKELMRDAIKRERYIELLGEGHRWYDMRRWLDATKEGRDMWQNRYGLDGNMAVYNNVASTLGAGAPSPLERGISGGTYFGTFKNQHYLYPVPSSEVENFFETMVQNPGW